MHLYQSINKKNRKMQHKLWSSNLNLLSSPAGISPGANAGRSCVFQPLEKPSGGVLINAAFVWPNTRRQQQREGKDGRECELKLCHLIQRARVSGCVHAGPDGATSSGFAPNVRLVWGLYRSAVELCCWIVSWHNHNKRKCSKVSLCWEIYVFLSTSSCCCSATTGEEGSTST